jgi:integrase
MGLKLCRRHRKECEGGHLEDSFTGEFEEHRRGWKKCACAIHASGSLSGKYRRLQTAKTDWEEAKAVAALWEKAGNWEGVTPPPPPPPEPAPTPSQITVADACAVFLTHKKAAGLATSTLSKYQTFNNQICAFAAGRGYMLVAQFTATDIDIFWANWAMGARAKGKRLTTLRRFFKFCERRKWIAESPVSADIKAPVGSSKPANKLPFSDEEIARIIAACDKPPRPIDRKGAGPIDETNYVGATWKNETGDGEWTGEDVKDIIWLMVYTGYRLSDATFFDMKRLQGNQVLIRAQKNGKQVLGVVPDWLRDRLLARAKIHGARPFIVGSSFRLETVTNLWRRRIAKAFAAAGDFEHPPTPHRFRHTFARVLLEKGVSVADVAELMGDDEETIREHYAAWVPERQARLTRVLTDAFSDKPRLVGIQGGRA